VQRTYREFPGDLIANFWGYGWPNRMRPETMNRYGLAPAAVSAMPAVGQQRGGVTREMLFSVKDRVAATKYTAPGGVVGDDQADAGPSWTCRA